MDKLANSLPKKNSRAAATVEALASPHRTTSVTGEDGLPHCSVCNKAWVSRICIFGHEYWGAVGCDCDKAYWEEERIREEQAERARKIECLTSNIQGGGARRKTPARKVTPAPTEKIRRIYPGDDCLDPNNSNWAADYIDHWQDYKAEGVGAVLCGPCGTGKSWTAQLIADAVKAQYGESVLVTSLPALVDKLVPGENNSMLNIIASIGLLIIDDLGVEACTPTKLEKIWQIVDARYKVTRPTIYTTNLSPAQLRNPHSDPLARIYGRVLEGNIGRSFSVPRRKPIIQQDLV